MPETDAGTGKHVTAVAVDDATSGAPGLEIDLEDGCVVLQAADAAFEDTPAFAENGDAVAHQLDLG